MLPLTFVLFRLHANRSIESDGFSIEHWIFDNALDKLGIFIWKP